MAAAVVCPPASSTSSYSLSSTPLPSALTIRSSPSPLGSINFPVKADSIHPRQARAPSGHRQAIQRTRDPTIDVNVFDEIPKRDAFAWNGIIASHLADGDPNRAVMAYCRMLQLGVRPDKHTLPRVLTALSLTNHASSTGKQVHAHVFKFGFASDDYVVTALISMYNETASARKVFGCSSQRNPVSWTRLAKLYLDKGKPDMALGVFKQQMEVASDSVDFVALITAMKSCGQMKSLQETKKLHGIARTNSLEDDLLVGNSILKAYVQCGSTEDARAFFEQMPTKDAVTWTTIIGGYVQTGEFNEGLKLFRRMCAAQVVKPDCFTITSILPACARMCEAKNGKEIHAHVIRHGLDSNLAVQNALMDMYVKSGFIECASDIFKRLKEKNHISWTVMILGHSLHGQGEIAVQLFQDMEKQKHSSVLIDQTSYGAVLYACNTARLVEEGKRYFGCITNPRIEHFALMVSLLARAGKFEEAQYFIMDRNIRMHAQVQKALLQGCRTNRNTRLGKRIAEQLNELEPLNPDNYVLLSNLHAANEKWDTAMGFIEKIEDMGLKAKKAYSWIEVKNKVHVFGVGDVSHPRSNRIYWEIKALMKRMREEGHLPEDDFSLHDVDGERESIPYEHSEMLAIAFGLISIHGSATIRVTKNLRVCRNCHSSVKMMSKMLNRDIMVKDPDCFHHFKNGYCSCKDFW